MKTKDKKEDSLMVISSSGNDLKVPEHHIRQRAFEIYLNRDKDEGNETTDWFQAKHELNPSEQDE